MKEGKYSPMFLRHDPGSEGRFGYDITNPIRALSVRDSYRYLNRLRPRRDSVKFEQDRVCSMSGRNNNIIDKWVFFCEDSASHTNFTFTIYVDPYCEKTSKEAFDGWMLLEE